MEAAGRLAARGRWSTRRTCGTARRWSGWPATSSTCCAPPSARPEAPVSALPLMARGGARRGAGAGHGPGAPRIRRRPLHRALRARRPRARRTPSALVFGGRTMTYAELDRARQPARAPAARRCGVGPGGARGRLHGAGAGDGRRPPRRPQGGRRVRAAGSRRIPPSGWRTCWRIPARAVAAHRGPAARTACRRTARPTLVGWTRTADARADEPADAPEDAASRTTWRTSSTPPAPPAVPRARRSRTRGVWPATWRGCRTRTRCGADDVVLQKTPFSLRPVRHGRSAAPLLAGGRAGAGAPGGHREPAYLARAASRERRHHAAQRPLACSARCWTAARVRRGRRAAPRADARRRGAAGRRSLRALDARGRCRRAALREPVRPHRDRRGRDALAVRRAAGRAAGGVPIGRPVADTPAARAGRGAARRCPWAFPASCTSAAGRWRAATWAAPRSRPSASSPTRSARSPARGCTAPATACAGARTARWSSWGAWTSRSRCAASASSRARSRPRCWRHPAVREAAAAVVRGGAAGPRLVAYVGPARGAPRRRRRSCARTCAGTLPEHMVPSAFVPMDALPLTAQRQDGPPRAPRARSADGRPRRTWRRARRRRRCWPAIWAELLGVERVGVDGRLLRPGRALAAGHARGLRASASALGVEVPVRAVFEHPALGAFAAEVDRLLRASAGTEAPPIRPADRGGDLPLSFAQERLWFVDRLEPGSPVYHMPFALPAARRAGRGRPAPRPRPRSSAGTRRCAPRCRSPASSRCSASFPPRRWSCRCTTSPPSRTKTERDAATEAVMRDVAPARLRPGARARSSAPRWCGWRRTSTCSLVNLHHVISDGWSTGVLWNELSALYAAFRRGEPSPLPEPALQYGDFAVWQRAWLAGEVLDAQLGYWRRKLAGAPPLLELPTDRPRPAVQTYAGAAETVVARRRTTRRRCWRWAAARASTLFMVLLAAMDVVFGRLAGQDDVVIGTPIAGRTRARDGGDDRPLPQLAGPADGPVRRAHLPRAAAPRARDHAGGVRAPGPALRAHPGGAGAGAVAEPLAALPGDAEPGQLRRGRGRRSRAWRCRRSAAAATWPASSTSRCTRARGRAASRMHLVYNTALFDAPRVRAMLAQLTGVLRQAAEDAERPVHAACRC